jgi:hypothetical protein
LLGLGLAFLHEASPLASKDVPSIVGSCPIFSYYRKGAKSQGNQITQNIRTTNPTKPPQIFEKYFRWVWRDFFRLLVHLPGTGLGRVIKIF